MSDETERGDRDGSELASGDERLTVRAGRFVFGDRLGLALWLGLALVFVAYWRVGFYLTDTHAVANTVLSVSRGQLAVTELRFPLDTLGAGHTQPGLHEYDGVLYGRNYGQVVAAVPVLWLLQGAAVVAAPRLVIAGGWSLAVVAFAVQTGRLVGATRRAVTIGVVAGLGAFVASVALSSPLDGRLLPLVALQAVNLAAAAGVGVLLYRILGELGDRRLGLAAGVAGGVASPIGFWATLPKRHVVVAALVLATVLAFAVSRQREDVRARALAYGFAGAISWVHGLEGFFVVATLAVVDLSTARSNGGRALLLVGAVLFVSLAPAFATNVAIAGDPFHAPRLLPAADGGSVELAPETGQATADSSSTGTRSAGSGLGGATSASGQGTARESQPGLLEGLASTLAGLVPRPPDTAIAALGFVVSVISGGLARLSDPDALWHVFVRSGRIPGLRYGINGHETIELTVLESAPLLGALVAVPVVIVERLGRGGRSVLARPRALSPARQTDLLVAALATVLTVVYLSRLPLHSTLTVRYVLPVFPLAVYGVARIPAVSSAVTNAPKALVRSYATSSVLWFGGGLVLTGWLGLALGEAVQLHALVDLGLAGVLAAAAAGRTVAGRRVPDRWVATALGVAAGVTTAYVLASGVAYFRYADHALDLVRIGASVLPVL